MHKTVEQWRAVKAEAVTSGSVAQATNVLQMALDDIQELGLDGWQDISTAPKDGTEIILFCLLREPNYGQVATGKPLNAAWHVHQGHWLSRWQSGTYYSIVDATHWQPFPKPPVTK